MVPRKKSVSAAA